MAQIQGIRIKNYKALKDITLGKLWNNSEQPLTQLTVNNFLNIRLIFFKKTEEYEVILCFSVIYRLILRI